MTEKPEVVGIYTDCLQRFQILRNRIIGMWKLVAMRSESHTPIRTDRKLGNQLTKKVDKMC